MKAVILAAGKGTRMRDLTRDCPKPMLPVQGKPILQHIIEGIRATGIREFFVVTGWKAEVVEEFFGDGSSLGVRITFGRQKVQDGTGRAADPARGFVGEDDFLLTYGDILVRADTYQAMRGRWGEGEFAGLVTVTGSEDVTKGGLMFFDGQFCLRRLVEKPSPREVADLRETGWLRPGEPVWYNAGIYLFRPSLFRYTDRLEKSPRGEYELTDALSAMVADGQRVAGLSIAGRWVDVRDPEVLARLESEAGAGEEMLSPG